MRRACPFSEGKSTLTINNIHDMPIEKLAKLDDSVLLEMISDDTNKQFILAEYFREKEQEIKNGFKRAHFWYREAARKGHIDAQLRLAMHYSREGVDKNEKKSSYWYRKAAEQGDENAQFYLGNNYFYGRGVKKNNKKAFFWMKEAAQRENSNAQANLGYYYLNGIGVEIDKAKSLKFYIKAAKNGNPQAQNTTGYCFLNGIGATKDTKQAFYWFNEAAKNGSTDAELNLGTCYCKGIGVAQDETSAVYWYQKAANKNHANAQFYLSICYAEGKGIEKDAEKAAEWCKKAAENNCQLAKNWIDKKISNLPDFIFAQATNSKDCFVPDDFPPRVSQIGPYCGVAAFVSAINYSRLLDQPLYATEHEKLAAGKSVDEKANIVLHQLQHNIKMKEKWRSENGEIFNIKLFKKLAKHYGIAGCEAVLKENCTEEEYQQELFAAIKNNYVLIISCDSTDGMPVQNQAKNAHWVFSPAYVSDSLAVIHQDLYCLWPVKDLYKSNQMPEQNPHKAGGDLHKFRHTFFKVPINRKRNIYTGIHNNKSFLS